MSTLIERIRKYDSVVEDYENQYKECSSKQTEIRKLNKQIKNLTREKEELEKIIMKVPQKNRKRSNKRIKEI